MAVTTVAEEEAEEEVVVMTLKAEEAVDMTLVVEDAASDLPVQNPITMETILENTQILGTITITDTVRLCNLVIVAIVILLPGICFHINILSCFSTVLFR